MPHNRISTASSYDTHAHARTLRMSQDVVTGHHCGGKSDSPFDSSISILSFATSSWSFSRESEAVRFSFKPWGTRDEGSVQRLTSSSQHHLLPTQFAPFPWPFQDSLWDLMLIRSSRSLFRFWESSESERHRDGCRFQRLTGSSQHHPLPTQFAPFPWPSQVSLWDSILVRSSCSLIRFWESSESERSEAGLRDAAYGSSAPSSPLFSFLLSPIPHPEPGLQPPVSLWFSGWWGFLSSCLTLSFHLLLFCLELLHAL